MNYNYSTTLYRSNFDQMYKFLVEKNIFTILTYEFFMVEIKSCILYQIYIQLGQNTFIYRSSITVALVHVNIFI